MKRTITVMAMVMALTMSMVSMAMADIDGWEANPGTTVDNGALTMDTRDAAETPLGTSFENEDYGVAGEAGTSVEIQFTFKVLEGDARCDQGAPRVFVRGGDEFVFASGGQDSADCPGEADPSAEPLTITGEVDGGDLGHVGLVFDNTVNRSLIEVTQFSIDGVEILVAGPTSKDDCKRGGFADFGFDNQGRCIASIQANANANR